MNLFSRISTILCTLCVFCTAAEQRRAEIYIDEDLYKDADVLAAAQKYAGAVEKEFNFKIDIKSFPAALVLDSTTLSTSPKFKQKSTAAELKAAIKESWEDKSKTPLAGVILIGNLPFARMEYFARESDGRAAFPGDVDRRTRRNRLRIRRSMQRRSGLRTKRNHRFTLQPF